MLLIDNDAVAAVLTMEGALQAIEEGYRQFALGEAICRPRIDMRFPTGRDQTVYQWGTMEGGSAESGYFAIRMKSDVLREIEYAGTRTQEKFCVSPGTFCGLVLLLSVHTGEPLAILNDGVLQHTRVGADSAIGAKYAARENAAVLGILGSGGMARTHVESIRLVRPIEHVCVYSPTTEHARQFCHDVEERFGLEASVMDHPRDAFAGADIVCGCTDAAGDVIVGEWLERGTHVTSVGGGLDPRARESIDVWLRLGTCPSPLNFPDWRPTDEYLIYAARPGDPVWAEHRAGGVQRPPTEGDGPRQVTLEDILLEGKPARSGADQITFSERGNIQGAQFHAVAGLVYSLVKEQGLGVEIPTEWFLQDIRD